MSDSFVWFFIIGVSIISTLFSAIIVMKMTISIWKSFLISILINTLVFFLGSLFWLQIASDGFSQYFGIMYFGFALILIQIGVVIYLYYMKKNLLK